MHTHMYVKKHIYKVHNVRANINIHNVRANIQHNIAPDGESQLRYNSDRLKNIRLGNRFGFKKKKSSKTVSVI